MRKIGALTFALIAAGMIGAAHADIFAGVPVYAGAPSSGSRITCRVFNPGSASADITVLQIFDS